MIFFLIFFLKLTNFFLSELFGMNFFAVNGRLRDNHPKLLFGKLAKEWNRLLPIYKHRAMLRYKFHFFFFLNKNKDLNSFPFLGYFNAMLVFSHWKSTGLCKIIDNIGKTSAEKTCTKSLTSNSPLTFRWICVLIFSTKKNGFLKSQNNCQRGTIWRRN